MSEGIRAWLEALPTLGRAQLAAEWQRLFGTPRPAKLRKEMVVRILAYRAQEKEFGGLSPAALRRLRELSRVFRGNPRAPIPDVPSIKLGTRLVRSWRGQIHQVTVVERGYEFKNRRYSSLSEIARLITGTRWNGPLFFGLRKRGSETADVA